MSLRVGDLRKGVQTALEIPGRIAKRDCGLILEQLRQFDEAGRLYEAGLFYDRAVASYLRAKDWVKVNELIDQVRSPKILCQYGKILVNEKKYERAYEVYSKARDYENMIALLLKNLNKPEEAVRMAQESRSIEGAKMVAKFFSELGNNESAIEFLVLSQCFQEAYELAEQCDRMDIYARSLESTTVGATENQNKKSVPVPDNIAQLFAQLVDYYTQHSPSPLMAGKFAGMAKNYVLAMHHLTQNPKFLFQFYVRLKMYPEAAKTAIIIAQDQQSKGFYKTAHDLLFGMYRTLTIQKIHIPAEMENNLQLLHSYNIVKGLIRRGDNYTAARLLIRVSDNISQFPMHAVPILTSTVITCTKAGFKASAFKFASQLLQPNYRQKIDDKYKRKIETVVRKSDRNAVDTEGRLSPCPQCTTQMDEFNLTCTECKSTIPYCIVTGRHVVDNDFALCSACSFPGYFSEFNKLISLEENCPMCHDKLGNIIPSNYIDYINSLEIQT
ncbi:hypothetical protein Ddc_02658 [Ditylenchus destructor]|nr:hypothetical protein Ddc_02658 [Ditylenchus destructor]